MLRLSDGTVFETDTPDGEEKMRPVEQLFGPTGLVSLKSIDENTVLATCRNGMTKKFCSFETTNEIGVKLAQWKAGKGGDIQDFVPELSVQKREMCLSGMTPEDWCEVFGDNDAE